MLHSHIAQVPESSSESRHRASASLGKTHFKLAPGLITKQDVPRQSIGTQTSHHYDELWRQWMTGSSSSQASLPAPSSSYDSAWTRWMNKHSPQVASSSSPAATPFEAVPRDAMLPIMSRLPLQEGEVDDIAAEPTKAGNLDYLTSDDEAGGMHTDDVARGQYTRARLPELDTDSHYLWQSLHSLRAYSDDYSEGYQVASRISKSSRGLAAPHPIAEGMDQSHCPAFADDASHSSQRALALVKKLFNWDQLPSLPIDMEGTWYGVAFRSKRRPGSESTNLYEDDRRSHEEAVDSGGLLMYWYGRPSEQTGHNLATCIWTNRADAIKASSLPLHARAAVHSRKAYESFELSRYAIRKVQGETKLRLEEWIE